MVRFHVHAQSNSPLAHMILSVVATPIGNLKDISFRAKEILEQATLIVAEDTRTTGQLLKLLEIKGEHQFISFHAQTSPDALEKLLAHCEAHEHIALVTDAGTPGISDPGCVFVDAFRKRYSDALIVPIPGPSAVIAALSACGFPTSHFEFLGFIPHKKGKQTLFATIATTEHTIAFYESPHRIVKTFTELSKAIGERPVYSAREITKVFEEYRWGTASEHGAYYEAHPDKCRGEFVVVIAPLKYHL